MKRHILALLLGSIAIVAGAAPIDDAKSLYKSGNYAGAIAKLSTILKSSPKDGNANYYLGASYYALGEYEKAVTPLTKATDRGVADAPRLLAEIAILGYDFETAADHIDEWESILERNKKSIPDELNDMRSRVMLARNMMQRVEKIEIVDSVNVDADDFFNVYVLSDDAGQLLDASVLPDGLFSATGIVYRPSNGKQLLWSGFGNEGHRLMKVDILDDGTFQSPTPLGDDLAEGGDADYPFLCADGVTFYFASNGENSLGGYDIFLSRIDNDGEAMQPQNIGMPYNSPANDFMLAIDEENNLGWWATDRNNIPGQVTIYTFRPNSTRVNVAVDDPDIRQYASLENIELMPGGRDMIADLDTETIEDIDDAPEFVFPIGNGKVYTRYSDFRSQQARQAMRQLVQREKDMAEMETNLENLRRRYAAGDKGVAQEILNIERRILADPPIKERLINTIISQESK